MNKLLCFALVCAVFINSATSLQCPTSGDTANSKECRACASSLNLCFTLTNTAGDTSYYGCDDSSMTKCKEMRQTKFSGNGICVTTNKSTCGSGSPSKATGLVTIIPLIVLLLKL